ncbi:MAG: NADH-quinone oxidoreductase subunit M [Chitinophagales bacterium]|mgnify:CR=1 FL=1|nr:NADH-quinone oxidoreductase subunit M [Chitinophagales bacterium]
MNLITAILIFFPLASIPILYLVKQEHVKYASLVSTLISLVLSLFVVVNFQNIADTQFLLDYWWIESLGISFKVGIDGISLLMVLLTNFLMPIIVISNFNRDQPQVRHYHAMILATQMAFIGVFVALDAFLFYIFWELALIPMYFICLFWGKEGKVQITFKFFLYTLAGSLVMLVALIYLYLQTPAPHTFDIAAFYNLNLSATEQSILFWGLFLGFAIKVPLFPVHGWLPDTHTGAPTQGTLLLAGIMLKMGIYGVIRWVLPIVPEGVMEWKDWAIMMGIIGIVYGSCVAIVQKDFKRLIAFSSIGHLGLTIAGIFALNIQGLQGGLLQAVNHGITSVGLFFIADIIYDRTHTREISKLGGIVHKAPTMAVFFMIMLLGSIGLPLTNGFVGEFLLFLGLYQYNMYFTAVAGLGIILGAVYMLRSYQRVMLGETNSHTEEFTDILMSEKVVLGALAIAVFAIGIYPKPLLNFAEPALQQILEQYNTFLTLK